MKAKIENPIQPDWWTKTIVGTVLGLSLAIALGNLIVVLGKPFMALDLLVQIGMWSIAWLWMPFMFFSYLFSTGKLALFYMSLANIFAFTCLFLLRG